MVDNNERLDTSQQNANPVFNENAAFDASESSEPTLSPTDAFAGLTPEAPEGGQPSQSQPQEIAQPETNNDETRYQYWQSQADKEKNENSHLRDELNQLKGQLNAMQPQQPVQQPVQEPIAFPDPPDRPRKPGGYNREEAYSDPSSASARYVDELEGWRDDMDEYNTAKSNYNQALVQEQLDSIEKNRIKESQKREAQIQQTRQMSQLKEHVAKNYQMDQTETQDFITKMSDPNSISMDNLVQLYRMQKGTGNPTPTQNTTQPSAAFQQTQRAQQVPQPMGVQPSSGNVQAPAEDQIMDNLIDSSNKNNPWG